MRSLVVCVLIIMRTSVMFSQVPSRTMGLPEAMRAMPQQIANNTFDMVAFTDAVEASVTDERLDVKVVDDLILSQLQNADLRIRKYAILVASQIARRPNSAVELAPILDVVATHMKDEDSGMRLGALEAVAGQRPQVPEHSIKQLQTELARQNYDVSDFSADVAAKLSRLRPNDSDVDYTLLQYLHSSTLSDRVRAKAVLEIASPSLSDTLVTYISDLMKVKMDPSTTYAVIEASARIGPRATDKSKEFLETVQADEAQPLQIRQAASKALQQAQQ